MKLSKILNRCNDTEVEVEVKGLRISAVEYLDIHGDIEICSIGVELEEEVSSVYRAGKLIDEDTTTTPILVLGGRSDDNV